MADVAVLDVEIRSGRAVRGSRKVQTGLRKTGTAATKAARKVTASTAAMSKGFVGLRRAILSTQTLLLTLGLGFGLATAIGTIREFEFQMASVSAISQATNVEFQALEATARQLGATTVFRASEAAEGMRLLAQAGFEANEIIGAIPGTLSLAVAGTLDLASASKITANIIRSFNKDASEAGNVADILADAAASSNTTVQGLGNAFSFVGGVANAANQSVSDVAAAIGILGDAGFNATRAGAGLNRILADLLNENKELDPVLRRLGITFADIDPRVNSLLDIFTKLAPELKDAGTAFKIFELRGGPTATVLAANVDRLRELTEDLRDFGGEADRIAKIKLDTLDGAFKLLRSAMEEATLQFGDRGFTGSLRNGVDAITGTITALNGMLDPAAENNEEFIDMALEVERFGTIASTTFSLFINNLSVVGEGLFLAVMAIGEMGIALGLIDEDILDTESNFGTMIDFVLNGFEAVVLTTGIALGVAAASADILIRNITSNIDELGNFIVNPVGFIGSRIARKIAGRDLFDFVDIGAGLTAAGDDLFVGLTDIFNQKRFEDAFVKGGEEGGARFSENFGKGIGDLEDSLKTGAAGVQRELEGLTGGGEEAQEALFGLREELQLLQLTTRDNSTFLAALKEAELLGADATDLFVIKLREAANAVDEETRLLETLSGVVNDSITPAKTYTDQIGRLNTLLTQGKISTEEFALATGIARIGLQDEKDALAALNLEIEKLDFNPVQRGVAQALFEMETFGEGLERLTIDGIEKASSALTDLFTSGQINGEGLREAAIGILNAFTQMTIQALVLKPILESLKNSFSGSGGEGGGGLLSGLFAGGGTGGGSGIVGSILGGITSAALASTGGRVGDLSNFGMVPTSTFSNAKRFQLGGGIDDVPILANRNEAVVPLRGGRSIPVEMQGGGATVNFNISTPDERSFRKNQGQLLATAANRFRRASGRNS